MRSERTAHAREEAAHAVAACRAGRRLARVSLDVCQIEGHGDDYRLEDAVVRVVGPLAIGDWGSRRRCDIPGLFDDRTAAEIICEEVAGQDAAAALLEAEDQAAALLRDPAFLADVDRLATRLLEDGEIAGPEAERLLGIERTDAATPPWRQQQAPLARTPWREVVPA